MAIVFPKKLKVKPSSVTPRVFRPTFSDDQSLLKPNLETREPTKQDEVVDMSDVEEYQINKEVDYIQQTAYFTDTNHDPPKKLPIPLRWSPYLVYKRILDHNSYGNFK